MKYICLITGLECIRCNPSACENRRTTNMFNPCIDYCYTKYGTKYSSACEQNCEYAKLKKENKELKEQLKKLEDDGK